MKRTCPQCLSNVLTNMQNCEQCREQVNSIWFRGVAMTITLIVGIAIVLVYNYFKIFAA